MINVDHSSVFCQNGRKGVRHGGSGCGITGDKADKSDKKMTTLVLFKGHFSQGRGFMPELPDYRHATIYHRSDGFAQGNADLRRVTRGICTEWQEYSRIINVRSVIPGKSGSS